VVVRKALIYDTNSHDVLSVPSRGRSYDPPGNQAFRQLVKEHYEDYRQATCHVEKNAVVTTVVQCVHETGGRFLQRCDVQQDLQEGVTWVELSPDQAHRKTRDNLIRWGSALRKQKQRAAAGGATTVPKANKKRKS